MSSAAVPAALLSRRLLLGGSLAAGLARPAGAADLPWMRLPPTPTLPRAERSGYAPVNGIRLWFATFGHGPPVVLVHGGLAHAAYWGHQVPALSRHYRVIVLDSRGHGRSTRDDRPIGYELMAQDVLGLMDHLHIPKAALAGWSDGGIIGLTIAMRHPDRLAGLFAFAANSDPSGVKDVSASPVFTAYEVRAAAEYAALSPTPDRFQPFLDDISHMWASEPHFSDADLRGIAVRTWIVDADHDEAIKREDTDRMAALIPNAGELILPDVSHFAMLQDPALFNAALLRFLAGA
jgi:pimeloyl-ACP methyl ester carboxylesterase